MLVLLLKFFSVISKITEILFTFVIKETIACFWKILLKIRIIEKKYKKTKLVKKQISGSTKKI